MLSSRKEITNSAVTSRAGKGLVGEDCYPCNGTHTSFSDPKITSTPLSSPRKESIFATPPKARLLSPRRYLLSEIATPPRSIRKEQKKLNNNIYKNSGPLLASLGYNESISTYEETKSPGIAGRIVQYNEEAERRRLPTHHKKYGSPGLFPVVHLFKKDLPTLEQKPKRVTIQIGHSDYTKPHSVDYRKLLADIVRPSFSNHDISQKVNTETNTRSVLDALKEISRKRIHSNEDYDVDNDNGKRQRTEQFINAMSNNKRLRDDSPVLSTLSSPPKSDNKRTCVYDEYVASCSSTKLPLEKKDVQPVKRKTASLGTLTENSKEIKQVKLINAETQTIKEKEKPAKAPVITVEKVEQKPVNNKDSPVKVFDDAPLERIRKSRLVTLMGQLVGKDAALTSFPDTVTGNLPFSHNKLEEKHINTSIVNENSPKSSKHVHFDVPSETPQFSLSASTVSITNTSTSVATPIVSAVISKSSTDNLAAPPSSPVSPEGSNLQNPTSAIPTFSFGNATPVISNGSVVVNPEIQSSFTSPQISNTSAQPTNTLGFQLPQTKSNTSVTSTNIDQDNTPKKIGGFKFDLSKPVPAVSSSPSSMSSKFASKLDNKSGELANTTVTSSFSVNFPAVPSTAGTIVVPTFSFTKPEALSKSQPFTFATKASNNLNFTTVLTTTTPNAMTTPSANFNTSTPTVNFGISSSNFDTKNNGKTSTGLPSVISFGNSMNPVKTIASTESFSFKAPTTTSPVFHTSSKPSGLASSNSAFGVSSTTPSFGQGTLAFGQTKPLNSVASTTSSTFGSSNIFSTAVTNTSGAFSIPSNPVAVGPPNIFGAVTTQSAPFGTTSNSTFGNAITLPFGTSSTSVTTSGFGSSSTAPVFNFGAKQPINNGFGGTTGFGAPTTTSTSSIFGTPQTFGGSSSVATTSANSAFGTGQTFGNSAVTSTTASSVFGATQTFGGAPTSGFGSSNSFGSTGSVFGSAVVPSFNQTNSTVTNNKGNVFNDANNGFGSTSAFGTSADKPAFSFGAGSATSAFVKPQPLQNVGTSSATAFGTPSAPNTFSNPGAQTGTFNFGAAPAPKPAVFAFGGGSSNTIEAPKVGFNFSSNSVGTPFGGGNPPTFGNATGPTFGVVPQAAPQFNAGSGATAGVFNIGAGSTSSRHRTQLKAKRRT